MVKSAKLILVLIIGVFLSANLFAVGMPMKIDWTSSLKTGKTGAHKKLNFSTPIVVGESVFVGNSGGNFYSINLLTGKKDWNVELKGPVESKPLFDDGALYLGDGEGYVYCISPLNGETLWHVFIGEEVMTTPAFDKDNIYVATENNSVFALEKSGGALKWVARRALPFSALAVKGFSSPIIVGDKIYVGNTDGVVVVYNRITGKKMSTIPVAVGRGVFADVDTTGLKYGGNLIFSSMEGVLYAINPSNNKEAWSVTIGTPNNLIVSGDTIYATATGSLYAVDAKKGKILWESDLDTDELSEPAFLQDYIVVVSTDDKIYLVARQTGEKVWERHLGGGTFGSPVVVGDRVIVLTNSGQVTAFKRNM